MKQKKIIELRNGDRIEYDYKRNGIYFCSNGQSVGEKLVVAIHRTKK